MYYKGNSSYIDDKNILVENFTIEANATGCVGRLSIYLAWPPNLELVVVVVVVVVVTTLTELPL